MRALWEGLPPLTRGIVLGVVGLLVALLATGAVWSYLERREALAATALAAAGRSAREALAASQEAPLTGAAAGLTSFLKEYPRSRHAAEAWLLLGNVEFERKRPDAAIAAYQAALARGSGTVAALSRLGLGYAWEAKGEPGRALEAYTAALAGRSPRDFLYAEALLGKARVEEQLGKPTEAVSSYRKFLADLPESPQGELVRTRLALLNAQP